jgi:Zn2+/Cd2+-exporting ATPase
VKEKKMLPVLGQEPLQAPATPTTRRDSENFGPEDGIERTVIRVEGMDCASCAATVEKRVGQLPGVRRAVVNFAAGRLDAEHDPALSVEALERAVKDAGYGVGSTQEAERTPFW